MIGHLAFARIIGGTKIDGRSIKGGTPRAECADCDWVGPDREGYHTASDDARRHMRETREAAAANAEPSA